VIKKPRGRGGHIPRWAAESEMMMIMMIMMIIIIIIIIILKLFSQLEKSGLGCWCFHTL
jgi:hypothetical protein